MERKMWSSDWSDQWKGKYDDTQVSGVYLSQGKVEHDIHDRVCIGSESREVVDDNTNHRGAGMVFHMMNPNDTWKKPCKISRTIIHQKLGGVQRVWCEYRYSTIRRKNAKASGDRSIGIIRCLSTRELWFPDREVDAIIHTDLSVVGGLQRRWTHRCSGIYRRISLGSPGESTDRLECRALREKGGART